MRRGFTLIELLVVIAIMGAMATVGVVSLGGSRGSTRLFAATRDTMAMVRRARSVALVTQKPVVLTYSNGTDDGEAYAKLEMKSEKLFSSKKELGVVRNLAGEILSGEVEGEKTKRSLVKVKSENAEGTLADESAGETLEDVLSPESIDLDVVKGLKLKVLPIDEQLEILGSEPKHSSISIFSTADSVSRTYDAGKTTETSSNTEGLDQATEEPVKVVFAVNGTVDPPHRIWIYKEESSPEKGLCIEVDRYGEPTCKDIQDQ